MTLFNLDMFRLLPLNLFLVWFSYDLLPFFIYLFTPILCNAIVKTKTVFYWYEKPGEVGGKV